MPAATAQRLTARPAASLLLTVVIGFLGVTWAGLTAAYYSPYPIGFWVTSFAFAVYLAAQAAPVLLRRARRRPARLAGAPA